MTAPTARVRRVEGVLPEGTILGITLLAIGAAILAANIVSGFDQYLLLTVSAICLTAFAISREYGFAVPAGITGGLGTMALVNSVATFAPMTSGAVFFLSLAGGFAAIWILGLMASPRETSPWPLAPAAVLGTLGGLLAAGQPTAFDWVQIGLAGLLVVGGGAMLVGRRSR